MKWLAIMANHLGKWLAMICPENGQGPHAIFNSDLHDVAFSYPSYHFLLLRLARLQQLAEDKVANEKAKNALESQVFETKDSMNSERVLAVSTDEQREVITTALSEAANWLEDEGYIADTKVLHSSRELVSCTQVCGLP